MYDSCVCVDYDGEQAEFFDERIVKARKDHICGECGDTIKKGEEYEYVVGKWEGDFEYHKTCKTCRSVRRDLFQCGWTYGYIWEDIRIAFEETLPAGEVDDWEWLK